MEVQHICTNYWVLNKWYVKYDMKRIISAVIRQTNRWCWWLIVTGNIALHKDFFFLFSLYALTRFVEVVGGFLGRFICTMLLSSWACPVERNLAKISLVAVACIAESYMTETSLMYLLETWLLTSFVLQSIVVLFVLRWLCHCCFDLVSLRDVSCDENAINTSVVRCCIKLSLFLHITQNGLR